MSSKKSHGAWLIAVLLASPICILLSLVLVVTTLFLPASRCTTTSSTGSVAPVAAVDAADYQAPEHSDDPVAEALSAFVESVALDDSHGYSQARRTGNPDYDCSSLVWYAARAAGASLEGSWPFATFTMGPILERAGFRHLTWSGNPKDAASTLRRGDVIVNPARHTETYLGGGLFGGARHAMGGGKEDGHPGDQGTSLAKGEIAISPYISSGMVQVYRHDPSSASVPQATQGSSASLAQASASMSGCPTGDSGASGEIDASYTGDGDRADPAQAKAIAKQLVPRYFPGADADKEFSCLVDLWTKESGWRWNADNPSSDAYGIPQSLPGSKMAAVGPDWHDNAGTQIKWGMSYIKGRADYGTPCKALAKWNSRSPHWY